jgi:hypothetical protein
MKTEMIDEVGVDQNYMCSTVNEGLNVQGG